MSIAPSENCIEFTSGSTASSITSQSFDGFTVGQTLFFGFFRQFTRTTGSNIDTLAAKIEWYNSSNSLLSTTTNNVTANGTTAWDFQEFTVVVPANATRAKVVFASVVGSGTLQHTMLVGSCRLGRTQMSSTVGADWNTNLDNVPPNLAALVGTEEINNALVLAEISTDGQLDVNEKTGNFQRLVTDLEARYTDLVARATGLAISTTAVTAARTEWLALINSYSPAYWDTSAATILYEKLFTGAFSADWTVNSVTDTASKGYRMINDTSGVLTGYISETTTVPSGVKNYAFGIVVEKSTNTGIKRIELVCTGGVAKTGGFNFRLSDGATGGASNATIGGVEDMGAEWFVWGTFTTNTGNTSIEFRIYPAFNATLTSATAAAGSTGSVNVRSPAWALGNSVTALGHHWLTAKLYKYGKEMTALAQAISTLDAATSVIIDPITDVVIYANSDGTPKTGELTRNVALKASIGTSTVTTLGTWTMTTTPGITASLGASTGILAITAFVGTEVAIPIQFVYGGVTRTANVHVIKASDVEVGSGGSSGSLTASTTTVGSTAANAYNFTTGVSNTLTVTLPSAGQVACTTGSLGFKISSGANGDIVGAFGKWRWRVQGGTYEDIAAEVAESVSSETTNEGGSLITTGGTINVAQTKTGLAAGTYEFVFAWRSDTASKSVYKSSNNTLTATGS